MCEICFILSTCGLLTKVMDSAFKYAAELAYQELLYCLRYSHAPPGMFAGVLKVNTKADTLDKLKKCYEMFIDVSKAALVFDEVLSAFYWKVQLLFTTCVSAIFVPTSYQLRTNFVPTRVVGPTHEPGYGQRPASPSHFPIRVSQRRLSNPSWCGVGSCVCWATVGGLRPFVQKCETAVHKQPLASHIP